MIYFKKSHFENVANLFHNFLYLKSNYCNAYTLTSHHFYCVLLHLRQNGTNHKRSKFKKSNNNTKGITYLLFEAKNMGVLTQQCSVTLKQASIQLLSSILWIWQKARPCDIFFYTCLFGFGLWPWSSVF